MAADFLSGDDPSQLPGQQLNAPPAVGGDMTKAVYDPNGDGKVSSADSADNAGHANSADEATAISGADAAGVNHYYGTDADGNVGFHALPEGGGGGGGGTPVDKGAILDSILTDGNDVLVGADGTVLYE